MLKEEYFGNIYSDLWAGEMADAHAISADWIGKCKARNEVIWEISKRIAAVRLVLQKQHDESAKEETVKRRDGKEDDQKGEDLSSLQSQKIQR